MPTLTVVAELKAKLGKEQQLQEMLAALLEPSRQDPGCINYDLHVGAEDPGFFLFYETWESKALWEQHMEAPHLQAFKAQSAGLVETFTLHLLHKCA